MSDEKTEEPTEHKLRKAREEGQVAKSSELATAVSAIGTVVTLNAMSGSIYERLQTIMRLGIEITAETSIIEMYRRMWDMVLQAVIIVFPLAIVAAFLAVIAIAGQIGLLFSMSAVMPKFGNVDPGAGLKRILSVKSLMSLLQMVVKAIVMGVVLWQLIVRLLPLLSGSVYQSVPGIGGIAWSAIYKVLLVALAIFVALSFVDLAIQRWQFMKGQRMSKDEIKREHKGQEGDPMIKGQRRQLAHELAQEEPRKNVGKANAVIVNPTHYAVAIRYQPEEFGLPRVIAKGIDGEALMIRGFAEAQNVPVFANPPLARALHAVPLGGAVPEELFEAVAAVLRWVNELGDLPAEDR